jgi:hypothetical protein
MKKLIVFMLSIVLLGSCISLHKGHIAPNSVSLSSDNFQVVKSISGEAKALYVLGIGGFNIEGLLREAKINMYNKYPPKPNEIITNITVDNKQTFFLGFLVMQHSVIVSADVVKFGSL